MFIEELHLISFKGFKDFRLKCSQLTTLVGLNNSGKTSILNAVQLVYDICVFAFGGYSRRDIERPDFSSPRWSSDPSYGVNRINLGDPDAIWLNKKTSVPCKIIVKFTGEVEVRLEIVGRNLYKLDISVNSETIKNSISELNNQKIIENIFELRPTYVPPVGGLSPSESFLHYPTLKEKLDKGQISECWRGNLYWLCNDGNDEDFNKVSEIVKKYLPEALIRPPKLARDGNSQILIEFEQDNITFDISTSGGGLRTIMSLAVVLYFSRSKCLLLDEPDAHLHSSLQRSVAQMLLDHTFENNIQILMTSHSPDFIAEVPVEYFIWVDRNNNEGKTCNSIGKYLLELGAITKDDAIRAYGADKILFIEGLTDRKVLSQLFNNYCKINSNLKNPFEDNTTIVCKLPNGKGDVKNLPTIQKILSKIFKKNVKIASLVDNDYNISPKNTNECNKMSFLLNLKLGRKEIENYLIEPDVIENAVKCLIKDRNERFNKSAHAPTKKEIESKIDKILNDHEIKENLKYQVMPKHRNGLNKKLDKSTKEKETEEWFEKNWNDQNWRIKNCSGKKVLAKLSDWCKEEYSISLTPNKIIEYLQQCPEDIQEIIKKINEFF